MAPSRAGQCGNLFSFKFELSLESLRLLTFVSICKKISIKGKAKSHPANEKKRKDKMEDTSKTNTEDNQHMEDSRKIKNSKPYQADHVTRKRKRKKEIHRK